MRSARRIWTPVIALALLGPGASRLEASRLKQAAALAAGLAVLAAGEPWLPPAAPVEGLGQHLGQECSDHCGSQFQLELVHCESLPPLLRNLCLTQILAEVEACMAKCLGEAGAEPLEPMP